MKPENSVEFVTTAEPEKAGYRKAGDRTNREPDAMRDHELAGIIDDLERGFNGDAWHGPPLCKVLDGVTADRASARPIPGGHSIWEIVAHLSA